MLGFNDSAVVDLQPERQLNGGARRLHHSNEADLPGYRIGHMDLEGRWHGAGGLPQAFANLHYLGVFGKPDVVGQRRRIGVMGDQRGKIRVDHRVQAVAVAWPRRFEQTCLRRGAG